MLVSVISHTITCSRLVIEGWYSFKDRLYLLFLALCEDDLGNRLLA